MTLKQALAKGIEILKNAGIETPVVDAGVLLCNAADCDRTFLYAHGEREIGYEISEKYVSDLAKRAQGVPVQYITGRCGFMSLDFLVGPGVLVPRPETEILVEAAADMLAVSGCPPEILDIGTGSGCIAVSAACMLPDSRVSAADISEEALRIARLNAVKNGVEDRLEFVRSDLFENLGGRRFDAVLSNPPYIRSGDIHELQREVRDFEPREALDGGPDGLEFYRRIAGEAHLYMKKDGLIFLEVGKGQAPVVAGFLERRFTNVVIIDDLAGIGRVVRGRLKPAVAFCIQSSII